MTPISPVQSILQSAVFTMIMLGAAGVSAPAATATWTAAGGTVNFSDAGNWDAFPTPDCIMVFPAGSPFASKSAPVNDLIGLTIDQLNIYESYTISGNAVTCKNLNDQGAGIVHVLLPISTAGSAVLTITVASATGTLNLSGRLTGAGPITYGGVGIKRLNGTVNNTVSGLTSVALGTLVLDSSAAESIAGPLWIDSGAIVQVKAPPEIKDSVVVTVQGTLDLSAATGMDGLVSETIGGLAGTNISARVQFGVNSLGCAGQSVPTGYAGGFSGTGGLRQSIQGTEILSGLSYPYTGVTTLAGGEIHIWGILMDSPVTVTAGTLVLANECTVGAVHVSGSTSRLSCDETMTAMTMHGSTPELTLGSGSFYHVVTKSLTRYATISAASVTLNGAGLSVDTSSYSPTPGSVMTIIHNTGAGPVSGTFLGLAEGSTVVSVTNPGTTFTLSYVGGTGHDVTLTGLQIASDASGPVISMVTSSFLTSSSALITWNTDEGSTSSVEYGASLGYGSMTPANPTLDTSHSVTLSGLQGGTVYHFRVISRDAAGNLSTSDDAAFTTTGDSIPPVITGIFSTSATGSSIVVAWITDEASDSQVEYGQTSFYGSSTLLDSSQVTSHQVVVTGLAAETTYHFRVISRDAMENLATSVDGTFTTTTGGPVVTPSNPDSDDHGTCGAGGAMALLAFFGLGLMRSVQRRRPAKG